MPKMIVMQVTIRRTDRPTRRRGAAWSVVSEMACVVAVMAALPSVIAASDPAVVTKSNSAATS
jgi:hypothetical protein